MLIFLEQANENVDVWKNMFGFLFDIYMFVFDVIWNTKIPLTNITLAYWIIFWMVVKLSIFAINGTTTQYNELGTTTSRAFSGSVKSLKNFKTSRKNNADAKDKAKILENSRDKSKSPQAKNKFGGVRDSSKNIDRSVQQQKRRDIAKQLVVREREKIRREKK